MNTYLVTLRLRSGLGTPLAADTLWGHIAWGVRYASGEAALREWLRRYDEGSPPLVVSDPMPAGFLPRPLLPPAPRPEREPSVVETDARRTALKRQWISRQHWDHLASGLSHTVLERALDRDPPKGRSATVMHAAINRLSGGTAQEGGGTLFALEQTYFPSEGCDFEVWVLSPDQPEALQQLFETALSGGYGRDGASGQGDLRVTRIQQTPMPPPTDANAFVLLGAAVPRPTDPATGFLGFEVRCGRLGGDFAIGPTPSGSTQRQKRPFHCLSRGSVLAGVPQRPWIGQLLANVHEDPAIRHYAMTPVVPIRLETTLLEAAS